ncbi:Uncharacterized protein BM_BM1086 [Brugia malayi]|uniref:Uncharacterized protein n=2 Tax=Brugia malayi TaxID=6279 RepID=A0A4E9F1J8_BRUMA|nr:Uncharacterized protein BM_BM1086 [Brugia malayi]VIO88380.1 Uncharacterized protein BM_BM1086 [Brugia malayi]
MVSSQLDDHLIHRRYYYYDPKRDFANLRDGRVIPDEERELIHIQYMPVNDDNDSDDDDNNNSGNESNERESEAETYISDEQLPSLSDDDSIIHWDDDMDPNELLPRLVHGDNSDNDDDEFVNRSGNLTNSRTAQTKLIIFSFGFFFCRIEDFTISEY